MLIRQMTFDDIDIAAASTEAEGWASETREIFQVFMEREPEGCFIAQKDGQRLGMIVAASYEKTGWLGELIVQQPVRGGLAGPRLFEHAIDYLNRRGIENIYLDGVQAASRYYAEVGFRKVCRSLRFLGTVPARNHENVRHMKAADLETVFAMDRKFFGDNRQYFLEWKWNHYPQYSKVLLDKDEIAGYIFGMAGRGIVSVGPWVVTKDAPDPMALLESLAIETGDTPLRIGVLDKNVRAEEALNTIPTVNAGVFSWRMVMGQYNQLGLDEACWAVGSAAKG